MRGCDREREEHTDTVRGGATGIIFTVRCKSKKRTREETCERERERESAILQSTRKKETDDETMKQGETTN
jgi:hypothetical protein